jgi:hypothetical protein
MSDRDRRSSSSPQSESGSQYESTGHEGPLQFLLNRFGPAGAQQIIQRKRAQRKAARLAEESAANVQAAAHRGTSGAGGPLPHFGAIQKSFGKHDISHVKAYTDGAAAEGAKAMGAEAFATGDRVAFAGAPNLHTAAHEAAHVVQQRGGVHLKGGVGQAGDRYEQHADAVADKVVAGQSAASLLDGVAGGATRGPGGSSPIQRLTYAIRHPSEDAHSYESVVEDAGRLNQPPLVQNAGAFVGAHAQVGTDLHIFGHGNQADIGGMSPQTLAQHLLRDCQMPRTVRRIILHSCESATPDTREHAATFGQNYAEQLHEALLAQLHHAEVTGQKGRAFTDSQGRTRVLKPDISEQDYRTRRDRAADDAARRAVEDQCLEESTQTFSKIHETISEQDANQMGGFDIAVQVVRDDDAQLEARSRRIDENETWKRGETSDDRPAEHSNKNERVHV